MDKNKGLKMLEDGPINVAPVDVEERQDTLYEWACNNKKECAYIAMIVVGIAALIITTIIVGQTIPDGVDSTVLQDQAMLSESGEIVHAPGETLSWGYDQVVLSGTVSPKVDYLAIRLVNNVAGALIGFGAMSLHQGDEKENPNRTKWKCLAFLVVAVTAIVAQELLAEQFINSLGKWEGVYQRRIEADFSPTYAFCNEGLSTSVNPNVKALWDSIASSMIAGISSGAFLAKAKKLREEGK